MLMIIALDIMGVISLIMWDKYYIEKPLINGNDLCKMRMERSGI